MKKIECLKYITMGIFLAIFIAIIIGIVVDWPSKVFVILISIYGLTLLTFGYLTFIFDPL